jgi:ribosome-associated toxin RatA of RatAB toxin-antitoxin module
VAFNCKNVKASVQAINELLEGNHFIMLQEHWLFQNQINLLGEVA